jgi:glycosyltransferase involved in cell wall biosynthesis
VGAPPEESLPPFDDRAKAVNKDLAKRLVAKYRPAAVLDVGCGYPYLVQCFQGAGVARALGVDRAPAVTGAGRELGVEVRVGDFLALDFGAERFDLITMIHALEEFADPAKAIAKTKRLLTDGGALFVRTACVDAPGIEAFLGPASVRLNPVLFSRAALCRAITDAGFEVADEWLPPDVGEVDVQAWLPETAIAREDFRVSVCLAAHNEESVIRRCLDSVRALAWEVVVYLNNCTDRTPEILKEWSAATKIPVRIIDGYWDDNFARAKNGACLEARGSHVAWMDADDVLVNPDAVLKALNEKPDHCQDWRLKTGNETLYHLRLWPNVGAPFVPHFHDRCHEYVELGRRALKRLAVADLVVEHRPKAARDSTGRNVRILERALKEGPNHCAVCGGEENGVGRTLFYLANAYREQGRDTDALALYDRYLSEGHGWHDERCWAALYKAQVLARLGRLDDAIEAALAAVRLNPHWAEPYVRAGWLYFEQGRFDVALRWAQHAIDMPRPKTLMFLDETAYGAQPWRLASLAWEKLGNVQKAIVTGEVALSRMAEPDPAWADRLAKLKARGRPRRAVVVGLPKRPPKS